MNRAGAAVTIPDIATCLILSDPAIADFPRVFPASSWIFTPSIISFRRIRYTFNVPAALTATKGTIRDNIGNADGLALVFNK